MVENQPPTLEQAFKRAFEQAEGEFKGIWRPARSSFLPERNGHQSGIVLAALLRDFVAKHPFAPIKLPTVYRLAKELLAADP